MKLPRWRLFPKYAVLIIAVVAGVLVISGVINLVFSWREVRSHLVALQEEKAQNAAARIEKFVSDIEHELGWTAFPRTDLATDAIEQRRIDYIKLQRQVYAITELVWIGPDGRERLLVSRLAIESAGRGTDLSTTPAFVAARAGKTWFGPVRFQKDTEPYMSIARPAGGDGGVTVAEVNLKFVWDVVSGIKIGRSGLAYVVDANGTLIAHPDISLVLKKTDLSELPQVAAVLHGGAESATAHDLAGHEVLAAHERIPGLNWTVFVETPRGEALAPLRDTVWRLVWLLIGGLLLAAAESFFLARALVRPIEALQRGAERVGAGELDQRIEVKTGDELEGLAEQFNQMGAALQASYAGLERKVEDRTRELSDALQQQTATAEVLQVISSSMADARPVFDKILDSCSKLFDSLNTSVMLIGDDGKLHLGASHGTPPEMRALYPMALGDTGTELAIRERRVLNFPDVLNGDGVPQGVRAPALAVGRTCSQMQAPLLWDERGIGSIVVVRGEVGGFTQKECELLRTFADQAVIAIQNARLFNETKEALERQTATSEVLRVISGSITDTQPVFDIIAERAVRLTGGEFGQVFRFNGEWVHIISTFGMSTEGTAAIRKAFPMRPSEGAVTSRAVRDGVVVNVPDVLAEPGIDPAIVRTSQQAGFRAVVSVPMIRDGQVIGAISVNRAAVGRFADKEVELLQTFASQAMIAIENVRLFNETREALEHQTATAEVLQVISGSVSNAAPVFEKILDSCERLFGASDLGIFLTGEDDVLRAGAFRGILMKTTASTYPRPLAGTVSGLAIAKGSVLHVPDMLAANEMPPYIREFASHVGNFSVALAPMMWEGRGIGTIDIIRAPPRPYSEKELALLKTFADQAVIAIQNARLFNETKEALEQQTATAEVLSVISSSVADTAPVFEKILHSCSHLFESSEQGIVLLGNDGRLHLGAHRGTARDKLDAMFPMALADEPVARSMAEQRVLHYPDVLRDAEPGSVSRVVAERLGVGSYTQVFAPMRWEGEGVGYLYVIRSPVAPFSDKEIGLLKTFADQAAIAIQNARLFHEIEDKSRQLEAANQHKSEFLANMSHELRTPLNAIIGFSEVLAEQMFGEVNDKQMEYLKDIHSSGQHLLELINDVLDLSKIEAGKMELDLSCFDLGLLLEHSTTLVRERAQRHGLALELDVGDGLHEWVADARKVKQIVVNLLSNAVKFTPNGGRIRVRARHLNGVNGHSGDWAEVSVSDTGVGIARQDQALVFEEFRQAGGDVLRKAEGTGLGLALVKRFVELHGGEVTLDSEPGSGSTFRFTLPQREVRVLQ